MSDVFMGCYQVHLFQQPPVPSAPSLMHRLHMHNISPVKSSFKYCGLRSYFRLNKSPANQHKNALAILLSLFQILVSQISTIRRFYFLVEEVETVVSHQLSCEIRCIYIFKHFFGPVLASLKASHMLGN